MPLPKPFFSRAAALLLGPLAAIVSAGAAPNPPPLDPANLDPNTKPGVDFYRFSNGGWMDKNPIPAEYSRWGAFEELTERNNVLLHNILDECAAAAAKGGEAAPKGSNRQKVGDFYASGMDEKRVDEDGVKPLAPEFERIAAIKDRAGLAVAVARMHELGLGVLFRFDVDSDEKDSQNQIFQAFQGGLGLPDRDYYTKDDERSKTLRTQYEEHVAKTFALLGDAPDRAAAQAKTVMAMETELAQASKTRVELRDPEANYHKMTMAGLDKLADAFEWDKYFTALGAPDPGPMDVKQPAFFEAVGKLAAARPLEDWKTYLRWHLVRNTAPELSKPFVDENFRFYGAVLTGAKEIRPRWKRILAETNAGLGEALGQLYVEKAFTPEAKARALAMINDLKTVLRERLTTLDWMGADTRTAALKKLESFGVKIGYPDKFRDYSALTVERRAHVLNVLAANAFETKRTIAKIGKPIDKTEWGMTPPTVNAYYNPSRNEIVFPAGILQPPFFDANADDAVNYGSMGVVIGHEMTHGFDDQGRQYDAEGNLKDWWTPEDLRRFKERSEAIVKQFAAYEPLEGAKINGSLTQGENIADLGGLKIAYAALQTALTRQGAAAREKKIDGFTPEQRFFLAYGQVWRNNIRPEALRLRLNTDPHSPGKYRVNGPLANLPEFQSAWGIPGDAPMLRPAAERVQIW